MSGNIPNVTGISPAEGPPGTVVKIRGENLGKNASDLLGVFICSVNCTPTAEWHPHYISCRTGMGLGNGAIIVVTKSGGKGTSTVKFKGYMPRVGLLTESAIWIDESKLFEEKPTSGLSVSRPMSPNYMANDPLGVAPEETGNFLPIDKLDEMYPKSSGNSLLENFHPARFLLEKHLDTSFDSLKSGFYHLESQDTRSPSAPASLVRSNLGTILESLDILGEVQQIMYDDKLKSVGGSITEELNGLLNNCSSIANSMFKDILSRKDDADAKRNALNVFQRFKFLFNLQRNIEKNIRQGDYEIVISDYNRAKALFQNSEVQSFRKVIENVDNQISSFMDELKKKLFEFPSTLDEQRRLIRYLTDLDCPGDPAWDCIVNMQQWIKNLFIECKNHYQRNESAGSLSPPSSTVLDSRILKTDSNKFSSSNEFKAKHNRTPSDGSRSAYLKASRRTPSRSSSLTLISPLPESLSFLGLNKDAPPCSIQFIEKLCELIVDNIPDLWQLGKAYLSGQVGNKMVLLSEDREAMAKHTKKFSAMVLEIIKLYCNLINAVLRPNSIVTLKESDRNRVGGWIKPDTLVAWLPNCGRQISSAFYTLQSLELPANSLSLLEELEKKVCEQCVKEVLKTTINEVKALENKETWQLVYDENNTCISQLPSTFEKLVSDSITFIKNFMSATKIDDKEQHKSLFDYIVDAVKKLIEAFASCLSTIVGKEEEIGSKQERSTSSVHGQHNNANSSVSLDKKLLITLSNCNYLKSIMLHRISEKCARCGFEEVKNIEPIFANNIEEIYNKVFEKYIENKGEPLVGGIEQGMLLGEYRWEDNLPLVGVRPYIRELVLNLVVIHNQVNAVSASFVQRIFQRIGGMVAEETRRIFDCYTKFSENGALQAYLEISVLEGCLKYHLTTESLKMLVEAKARLPLITQDNKWVIEDMVISFKKQMFFELVSFWPPEEVRKFEEQHGLLIENSASKQSEVPPKMERGKRNDGFAAPPKAPRGQEAANPPPKTPRGQEAANPPPKAPRGKQNPTSTEKNPASQAKTLFEVSKRIDSDNPFLDDDEKGNPFTEEKPSNPFEADELSNPFLDEDSSNPFLDDDSNENQAANPFLD